MAKHPGGSGRGNKGVTVHDDPTRIDCPDCGGFMKSSGKDWKCTECNRCVQKVKMDTTIKNFNESLGFDPHKAEAHARTCEQGKVLIVTSCQNNSAVSIKAFKTLKQVAKFYKAKIAVMPSHYRNVSLFTKDTEKEFDEIIRPYLVKSEIRFGCCRIMSDIRVPPTTLNPLSGKMAHGHKEWSIWGHPQQAREPVPTNGTFPKLMFTSGSISLPNYSVSDSGAKAAFHHTISALIIFKYSDDFCFVRQLSFSRDGHCFDLDKKFTTRGVTHNHKALALIPGDEHVQHNNQEKVLYKGKHCLRNLLNPDYLVRHDIYDGYSHSHHHLRDPMIQYVKHHTQHNNAEQELQACCDFINRTSGDSTSLIVSSNHHDHLKKWLDTISANHDHENAMLILELQAAMREEAIKGNDYDPFFLYLKDRLKCKHKFLSRNEPYYIADIDVSQHGDCGSNGSRGSARNLEKNPSKMVIGHSHGARIYRGVFQTGTSTGRLEYERGISDHSNTHCVIYQDGKRALIDVYDGKFKV